MSVSQKQNPSGIWNDFIPIDHDEQVSHIADTLACGAYSIVHKAEIRTKFLTGQFWEFSERAQAKLSGTITALQTSDKTKWGNSLENEILAIKNIGLILAQDWPELLYSTAYQDITLSQYYQVIPISVQKKAFKFDVSDLVKITNAAQLTSALQQDTTWTIIKTSSGEDHIVVRLNQFLGQWHLGQYYDSYEIVVKDFQPSQPIVSEWALTLTPKLMTNSYLIQLNKKDGTKEYAIAAPATKEDTLIDKCLSAGLPLATLNNGQNVDWSNVQPRFIINE